MTFLTFSKKIVRSVIYTKNNVLKSDIVLVCPVYAAGEKKDPAFVIEEFAKLISVNSNTQVILIKNQNK